MKTLFGSLAVLLSLAALAYGIFLLKFRVLATVAPAQELRPTPVVFSTPQTAQLRSTTTVIGTITAPRSIQLKTETVGTVKAIHFQSGDLVQGGQVLVELDTSVEQAMLASAKAAERIADSTYRRIKKAMEVQALTELDLDQTEAQLAQAKAEVARIEAIIRRKVLVAPFGARAGVFDIQPGQYLSEGSLITMLQGVDQFVYVDFMMPQQVADYVQVGDQVALEHLGKKLIAQVVAVDSQADRVTRSLAARAKVLDPPATLQVNDSVKVIAEYGDAQTTILIPSSALRTNPTGAFCFVAQVDPSDTSKWIAKRREVLVGATLGNNVSIRQGIDPKEQIIADGSFKIYDGTWVAPSDLIKAP
jgi:membrane fusion protein (multidrug efflux system)